MTIQEYFEKTYEDIDERFDAEDALFAAYEAEEIDIDVWAEEHGVDIEAMDDGHLFPVSCFTAWVWDMCGD